MSPFRLPALFLLLLPLLCESQVKTVKPVNKEKPRNTRLSIGGGITRSVLFLARNVGEDNDAYGANANISYGLTRLMRLNVEYTNYRPINIAPTWYDINAFTVEANMQFISKFQDSKTYFYPLVGISYNVFSGYFTGLNDFLNLRSLYQINQQVKTRWTGVNAGLGIEQFFPPFSVFGECKMRVGVSEGYNDLTIMDVCYSAGIRYNIRTRSLHNLFGGTRSRYLLDTRDIAW
jgi:hypothetical protein